MKINDILKNLIDELNKIHTKLLSNEKPNWASGLPNFTTAENGSLCYFDDKSVSLLWKFTSIISVHDKKAKLIVEDSF